jgi:Aspartyl/Asparaginyl beta-hydroxylase
MNRAAIIAVCFCTYLLSAVGFQPSRPAFHVRCNNNLQLSAAQGFGASSSSAKKKSSSGGTKKAKPSRLSQGLADAPVNSKKKAPSANRPYVKSEQDAWLAQLEARAASTSVGKVVAEAVASGIDVDPFWQLVPSLIESKFPKVKDSELERFAGFVRHSLDTNLPLDADIISDQWRPHDEIHAYMPGLGPTSPFYDTSKVQLCRDLEDNYEVITQEYKALLADEKDRFQSVTSMNYEAGWKTLVLFYNGHRIPKFPYHLCPTTTQILEKYPLAGRIAGFNRQNPSSGIPLHSDGNNMWLTTQMGIQVPSDQSAWIRVGPEKRYWENGKCLLYDTTYEHETMNESATEERVVLHVDFFNTLAMTKTEIEIMQYIYHLREQFLKAEGVAKVGQQIL